MFRIRNVNLFFAAGLLLCLVIVAASAEERVFVVNSYVHQPVSINFSTVVMLRGSDLAVLGTSDNIGEAAHSIAYTPTHDELWVTVPNINRTVVLDSRDLSIKRSMKIRDLVEPTGIAFITIPNPPHPPRFLAYITGWASGTVVIVDVPTYTYLTTIPVGGTPYVITFSKDGSTAYVLDDANNLSVIRISDNTKIKTLTWEMADRLQEMALNSSRLFITNQNRNQIEVVRISDNTKLAPIETDPYPRALGISGNGNYLFVGHCTGSADAAVAMLRLSDRTVVSDESISNCARRLVVRPDTSRIFVVDHNSDEIFAYDVAGETLSYAASADLNTVPGLDGASPVGIVRGDIAIPVYFAVFRPSSWNNWIFTQDLSTVESRDHYGLGTDFPLVADFNNGGIMDRAVFRNGDWKIDHEIDGDTDATDHFGMAGDIPVAGYLNNDRVTDRAVFRASEYNNWIIDYDMDGDVDVRDHFGSPGDIPLIGDFNNDWIPDRAVFRGSSWSNWIIDYDMDGDVDVRDHYGSAGDVPIAGRINRDLFMDRAVFRDGEWIVDYGMDGSVDKRHWFGWADDIPLTWWDL